MLYEDHHLLVADKPAGVVVHPAYKNPSGTLLDALQWLARDWTPGQRPSVVGRLDKLTSGIVVIAKTSDVHAALQRALRARDAEKDYLAVVYGRTDDRGVIDLPLGFDPADRRRMVGGAGERWPAVTHFERVAAVDAPARLSLLKCRLATGRRHQIRAHLAARGWPVVGDPKYGEPRWRDADDPAIAVLLRDFPRQALHASHVAFAHPVTGERVSVDAPVPADLGALLLAARLA